MNKLTVLSDKELSREYKAAFNAYLLRMDYFASLPNGISVSNLKAIKEAPEAYGITQVEYEQFVLDIAEHMTEGVKLGQLRQEYLRRIKADEEEKAAAKTWTYTQLLYAAHAHVSYERYDGGDVVDYLKKVEHATIRAAKQQGKFWGMYKSYYPTASGTDTFCYGLA